MRLPSRAVVAVVAEVAVALFGVFALRAMAGGWAVVVVAFLTVAVTLSIRRRPPRRTTRNPRPDDEL